MSLTPKQKQELHQALASYLFANGFQSACDEFVKQLKENGEIVTQTADSSVLEKKWTTVVRLQKRVMDLEGHVKQLEADLRVCGPSITAGHPSNQQERRNLPRGPHLHTLAGHRSAISRIAFHPVTSTDSVAYLQCLHTVLRCRSHYYRPGMFFGCYGV